MKRFFLNQLVIAALAVSAALTSCNKDKDPEPGDPTMRYETVPYVATKSGGLSNLVFTDYDDDHNYYFFVMGHINSVPLAYRPAVYYNGRTPITVGYSSSNVTQTSISNSVTEAFDHSVTESTSDTWGHEVGFGIEKEAKVPLLAKVKFEASYKHSWGGSESTDITNSRSFSNTFETSNSKASEIRDEISVTIGNNNEPSGLYRFSLFTTTDVYFVVVTDRAKTEVISAEVVFCARPTQYWELDYDPERGGSFGKTASGALLQIPELSISQLPDIAECTHNWEDWVPTIAPTCETAGEEIGTCSLCQRTQTRPVSVPITGTFDLAAGNWATGSGNATFSGGVLTVTDGASIIITSNGANTSNRIVVNGIAAITLRDVRITGSSPMILNTGANVILFLEGTNILTAGSNSAGLQTTGATLTINGQGSLVATGGNGGNGAGAANSAGDGGGAGIGGRTDAAGGTVTINSGTITAQGGRAGDGGNGHAFGGSRHCAKPLPRCAQVATVR